VRRAAKVDASQSAIVNALRNVGCSVQSLAQLGDGAPDLLVGRHGRNYLLEVKTGAKASQLNATQAQWHRLWRGSVYVVRTPEEALAAVGFTFPASGGGAS
jgi:hypothetical protein